MLELLGWGGSSDEDLKEGDRLFGTGSYAEAELFFAKAASNVTGYFGPETRRARILIALAQTQWKQEKLKEAYATAESARQLISARRNSSDLAVCLNLLGDIQTHRGNAEEARQLFREALEVQERVRPAQGAVLVQRCRQLAKALVSAESSEARALLDQALAIAGKRVGTRSLSAADCLLDLAEFQLSHQEMEAGIASMERAIEIYRELNGNTCEEAARGFQRLAQACHLAGDLEKAVHYYEKALHIRDRQVGGNPADLGVLLLGLAEAQSLAGNEAPTIELLQQAVGKLQGTGDGHLADALESLGASYARAGRFTEAISCHQKSRALWATDPEGNREQLEENALRLEEVMSVVPQQEVSSAPIFHESPGTRTEAQPGSRQGKKRRMSASEFYGPPPSNGNTPVPEGRRSETVQHMAPRAVPAAPPPSPAQVVPLPAPSSPRAVSPGSVNPVPINLEIHAPQEQRTSNTPPMPHVGSADPAAIPALVKLSGIDQSVLSQRTLHLTVSDPSQNRPAQPAVVRPSAEASFSSANPVPINIEIHAPAEQRASNVQPMPDLGMAGSPPTPALVTLSGIDPSVLSLQTLHLAVFDPSQTSPAPPSTSGRPSAKNAMLSGWDELEFDFLSASN